MLNIFYQKNSLNDTLIINLSSFKHDTLKKVDDVVYGYKNNKLVFVNIFNFSKYDNLNNGMVFLSKGLNDKLFEITKINFLPFFDNGFKIGEIISCNSINNTHLHICDVNIGKSKILKIICGAKNVKQGLKVVVATIGTILPSGKLIQANNILNFESNGMLCSYKELNLKNPKEGIIELDENYKVGEFFLDCYSNKE